MPQTGDFMPAEFWYWSTILLGFLFLTLAGVIIKRFLDKLETTLYSMGENITRLTENVIKIEKTLEHQEELMDRHDKDIKDLKGKRRGQ